MNDPIEDDADWAVVRTLDEGPRRVLGVLLEKAFTTPDQYPLTIKSTTTGCNQKSNRAPTTDFSEDEVESYLLELQELGLVAELHTDGGRALRYRHLLRKRYDFSEAQLAILTELWLRGRQQLGELRTRVSRMVPVETQEDLRRELTALQGGGWVRSSGSLERRGVEVDHTFYPAGEATAAWLEPADEPPARPIATTAATPGRSSPSEVAALTARCDDLTTRVLELEQRLSDLEGKLQAALG
ncbi:MAG: DUF480 domain-containing protein [Planctomycetaceae bacterium]